MTRRSKLWLAALFSLINLGGMGYAAVRGELLHTVTHAVLLFLGGYVLWRLTPWARQQSLSHTQPGDRLDYLQESVDAIALEVERIGEAQRFNDRLRAELTETDPPTQDR
jgi:hypothetical protein